MKKSTQIVLALSSLTLIGGACQVTPTNENVSNNSDTQINSAPEFLTYTNDTYKFSFQYPSTWTIEESSNNEERNGSTQILGISGPEYRYIAFSITQVDNFPELKTLIEQSDMLADGTSLAQISQEEDMLIDGRSVIKAQQATALGIPEDIYYVELENGNFLFISAHQLDDNLVEEKIINSLRFTGDWLTYTSEEYGFIFEYPSEYEASAASDEELYLIKDGKQEIKFYIQPYEMAPEQDSLLYSKNTLVKIQNLISRSEQMRRINDIPVLVGFGYDIPGGGFVRTAEFFIGEDYIRMSMQIFPEGVEQPKHPVDGEMRDWSAGVVEQLEQGKLLPAEELARVEVFDQALSTIKESWVSYTNEEFGFSLQHPNSWNVGDVTDLQPGEDTILFLGFQPFDLRTDSIFALQVLNSTTEQEINNASTTRPNSEVLSIEQISLDGKNATQILLQNKTNNLQSKVIVFEHENFTFIVSGSIDEGPFEQFLDSFIFSRPGWATYSNQDLGLRFMYPKEWNLTHAESGIDFVDRLDNNDIFEHQLVNIYVRWSSRHEDIVSESGLVDKSLDQWLDCSNTYEEQVSCSSVVIDGVDMIKREGKIQTSFGDSYVALAFKQDDFTVFIDARSLLREVSSGEPGNTNLDGLEYINAILETVQVD